MKENPKSNWKRWLSIATQIIGFTGLVLTGAAGIFDLPTLAQWGALAGVIVSAAAQFFGTNAIIKIKKGEG